MRVLVIGATGFIGARVCQRFLELGSEPVAMGASANWKPLEHLRGALPVIQCDIRSLDQLLGTLERTARFDRIINLAVLQEPAAADPIAAMQLNQVGMVNVFEAARRSRTGRVIFASSIAVYGPVQSAYGDRSVSENDYASPEALSIYGATKLFNEQMARTYNSQYGMNIVVLRASTVHGPGKVRGLATWLDHFVTWPALGKPAHVPHPANQMWSLIFVDDLAELFVRLALRDELHQSVYNSGGNEVNTADLVEIVGTECPGASLTFSEGTSSTINVSHIDNSRIQLELDWAPRSIRESVRAHAELARSGPVYRPLTGRRG